jgi:hypothetical protein
MKHWVCVSALGALCLGGCAETVPKKAAAPYDILVAAEQIDADRSPSAAPYMRAARDEIDLGNQRRAEGDSRGAAIAFMCADADARLAIELAKRERVLTQTRELEGRVAEMNAFVTTK